MDLRKWRHSLWITVLGMAATNYALAIEYSRDPERRGFFLSALAETYMKLNDPKQACAAYHQAKSVDPAHLPDYAAGRRGIPGCS